MTDDNLKLEPVTIKWLETRGISAAMAARHGVVTVNGKHPAFEYRDAEGKLLYRKVRVTGPDGSKRFMRDRKGVAAALFNINTIDALETTETDEPLIVCEGEMDALSWLQAGFKYVVSVPDGAQRQAVGEGDIDPLQDTGYQWLWDRYGHLHPELAFFKKVILATDDDMAGDILREELDVRLGAKRCWAIRYPQGCKDANEIIVNHPDDYAEIMREMVASAKAMHPDGIVGLMDIPMTREIETWETSWSGLSPHLKLTAPELCIISGEPGAGKSQFAFHVMLEMARLHNLNGLYLQFEDSPNKVIEDAENYATQWSAAKGNWEHGTGNDPKAWVNKRIFAYKPPTALEADPDRTLEWVKDKIETAVYQKGCKIVCIDPWNEIEHCWASNMSETQYTNEALRQMKGWARRLNICLIIVAHPGKAMQGKDLEECNLYDVSGSAAWNNKADHGILLKRQQLEDSDRPTNYVMVKVSKSKSWQDMGIPGTTVLCFDPRRRIYVKP